MNWKISDLIQATITAEVELAIAKGELEDEIRRALFRRYKDKRYRRRKSALNLQRVQAVAEELRRETA